MPLGDRRQNTHCDHFVAQLAEVFVALLECFHLLCRAFDSVVMYAVFGDRSLHGHHDVVEPFGVDINSGRPAERLSAHGCCDHFDREVGRALERRAAAQFDNTLASLNHPLTDVVPLSAGQFGRSDQLRERLGDGAIIGGVSPGRGAILFVATAQCNVTRLPGRRALGLPDVASVIA